MAKRKDVSSRREVTEDVETRSRDMEEKEVDLDKIASDVETVRQTLERLDFGGTQEGAEQLEKTMERAEGETEKVFDNEDTNLEEIQVDSGEYEEGLEDRQSSSESDLGKISDASADIETRETLNQLVQAKEATLRDIDFLAEQIDRARSAREKSDIIQEKHQSRVHGGKKRG